MNESLIQERINRGVALLDQVKPDWRDHVNADELDLYDTNACILGQLFDHYLQGLEAVGLHTKCARALPTRYGFETSGRENFNRAGAYSYDELTEAWKKELAAA
jgi:hypothetical protein